MFVLIVSKACILFSSGDIPYTASDMIDSAQETVVSEPDMVDISEETLMLSHLKLYHFPPRAEDHLELSYEEHTILFDDMLGCSGMELSWNNLTYQSFEEQKKNLTLPNGLYGAELTLESNNSGQFDDHMTLEVNGNLVYSSDIQIVDSLTFENSFDWNEVEGQSMSSEFTPFCGISCLESYQNGGTTSQTFNGVMTVAFDPNSFYSMLEGEEEVELSIKVFGDNDPDDCALSNMKASIRFAVMN